MNAPLEPKFENFFKALKKLEEALSESGYLLSVDGTIQRFEFTLISIFQNLENLRLLLKSRDLASY